jgi:GntR family transcriptional regulator, transcriptional repressor for pyruvate dehydrogenase complex
MSAPSEPSVAKGGAPLEVRRVQSSYVQVSEQLRDLILKGDLVTGQRLPSEAEMAPMFGVSRSTIREALRILVTEGLLVTKRGVLGGTFVAELDPARIEGVLNSALTALALTNKVGAADFLEAWKALEIPAASLSARLRGGSLLEELELTSRELPEDTSREERLRQSGDFHSALLASSDNFLLVAMGRPVSTVARAQFSRTVPTDRFWFSNTDEHRRIYEAIAEGDVEGAEREVEAHIVGLLRYYEPTSVTVRPGPKPVAKAPPTRAARRGAKSRG